MTERRVCVYVDGFNLYYGLFRGEGACSAASKWLNIVKLAQAICESRGVKPTVGNVRYCTARALPTESDPGQPQRQLRLLVALGSLPEVQIIFGQHKERPTKIKLYAPGPRVQPNMVSVSINDLPVDANLFSPKKKVQPPTILVSKREEKGSDVNLAAFLVRDAALNLFDIALVITDDSDLHQAIKIAEEDFKKEVWVASPFFRREKNTIELSKPASAYFRLNPALVEACQFPDDILDSSGKLVVRRPYEWQDTPLQSELTEK